MPLTFPTYVDRFSARAPEGQWLNIGCGSDIRADCVNLDRVALEGVDVVVDIGLEAVPLPSSSFAVILARDVLEHLDLVPAMAEIHRLLVPGGLLVISAPHFTSRNVWLDPTHLRGFSVGSFEFFVRGGRSCDRSYYFDFSFTEVLDARVQFNHTLGKGRYLIWDRLIEPLVNRGGGPELYEMTFLSRLAPAANVLAVLRR